MLQALLAGKPRTRTLGALVLGHGVQDLRAGSLWSKPPACCQAPSSFSRAMHSCCAQPPRPTCLMLSTAAPRGSAHLLSGPCASPSAPP